MSLKGLSASKRVSLGIFNTRSDIIFFCISSVPPAIEEAGNETRISAIVPSIGLSSPVSIASAPLMSVCTFGSSSDITSC